MLSMEIIDKVKYMYERQSMTMDQIADTLNYSRQTISKYLNGAPQGYSCSNKERSKPVTEQIRPIIKSWLEDNKTAPRKQRRTGCKIFADLQRDYNFKGSYSTVTNLIREISEIKKEVFVPREHRPGEYCEFDFGEVYVKLKGVPVKLQLHAFQLPYSNDIFGYLSKQSIQEEMFESHKRSFVYFEGIAPTIRYDNLSQAVKKVLKGKRREETDSFLKFRDQFGFDAEFCYRARGCEKGDVEGCVGYIRRNCLSPMPEINSMDELEQLNKTLADWCLSLRQTRKVPGFSKTVGELYLLEKEKLMLLPSIMPEVGNYTTGKANHHSLVPVDNVFYSVPTKYAHNQMDVLVTAREVIFFFKEKEVARHIRTWEKGSHRFEVLHYLDLFKTKPYTIINSKPIAQLPPIFRQFFEKARVKGQGDITECLSILKLLRDHSIKDIAYALELAISYDTYYAEGVKNLLGQLTKTQPQFEKLTISNKESSTNITIPQVDLKRYNSLIPIKG